MARDTWIKSYVEDVWADMAQLTENEYGQLAYNQQKGNGNQH